MRSTWRVAGRLARRETMRRPWRTLLVALLVAMPVAGMAVATVSIRTNHRSPLDRWRAQHGDADIASNLGVSKGGPVDPSVPDLAGLLPKGSRTVSYRTEYLRVLRTTAGNRSTPELLDLPMTDPIASPIVQITSGRAPTSGGEVFLTRAVARQLHVTVGATLRLERPQRLDWTVVGVGEFRAAWDSEAVILGPGTAFPWRNTELNPSPRTLLTELPENTTPAQLRALSNLADSVSFAPGVLAAGTFDGSFADEDTSKVRWSWVIGAVVLTVVGIVIAAAFAAGARRQLTTLGQLSANGASPSALRRVLFLQGTWTGLVGAILGLVLAAVALVFLAPHADQLFNRDVHPYSVRALDLIPIFLLGVAASTIAALVPARTTARIPVLAALAGRRPLRRVPPWLTLAGLAGVSVGLTLLGLAVLGGNSATTGTGNVWAFTAVVGGVAVLLGACAIAPGYVSILEPLASRLRGESRLAARSLARQRTRTGAVVSAVCATSALAIAASALVLAADARDGHQSDWMRRDEVQLRASTNEVKAQSVPVAAEVPDDVLTAITRAIPNAKVYNVEGAGISGADGFVRWDVRGFASSKRLAVGENYVGFDGGLAPATLADETALNLYPLPRAAREALDRDGIVGLIGGTAELSGTATVALVADVFVDNDSKQPPQATELIAPFPLAVVAQEGLALGQLPRVWVTPARARALGFEAMAGTTVVRSPAKLTGAQRAAVQDSVEEQRDIAADVLAPGEPLLSVTSDVLYPPSGPTPRLLEALLTGAALLLSLFVISVSLALSAAETRDERDVLAAIGASPSTMRGTSGRKALLLSFLGAVLAVPVGFLPVSVFTAASNDNLPLVFPWRVVGLLVAAVPIVVFGIATLSSGVALRLRPVHVSTMSFD